MAFRGTFEHTLDAKNRLTLPSRFRPLLAGDIVLAMGEEPCVAIWPAEDFESYVDAALGDLHPMAPERAHIERKLLPSAFDTRVDTAGRVMVPPLLIGHAGIRKDALVVGVGKRLEVWEPETWATYDASHELRELTARFGNTD